MTTKPPLAHFVPFHISRVAPLRGWREKSFRAWAEEQERKGLRKAKVKSSKPSEPKAPRKSRVPVLPANLDAATREMALRVMQSMKV